jgi:hypothetical protein
MLKRSRCTVATSVRFRRSAIAITVASTMPRGKAHILLDEFRDARDVAFLDFSGPEAARQHRCKRLQVEVAVYVAAVPDQSNGNDSRSVVDGVDHAVVARAHPKVRPVALKCAHARRARVSG